MGKKENPLVVIFTTSILIFNTKQSLYCKKSMIVVWYVYIMNLILNEQPKIRQILSIYAYCFLLASIRIQLIVWHSQKSVSVLASKVG